MPAVMAQDYPDFEVIVVDNGSQDGTIAWLRENYPGVWVIRNQENEGFARANNQGIRVSEGEYIALLNNDTQPTPDWLSSLVAIAEEGGADVGMVASQICLEDKPSCIDSAGIEVDVLGVAWNRNMGSLVSAEPDEPVEVFGPSAAAALYRRAMLDEIGLFREEFFAYYEDVELAWRARRAGWRCLYAPQAKVLHEHSATARRIRGLKAYCLSRNKWVTLFRHYPFRSYWIWVPAMVALDLLGCGLSVLTTGRADAIRGRWAAWKLRREVRCREGDGILRPRESVPLSVLNPATGFVLPDYTGF